MAAVFSKPKPTEQAVNAAMAFLQNKTSCLKIYVLGLQQIVDGSPPGEQNLAGWRFLADIAPDLAAAGEVRWTADDQTPLFAGLSYGPRIAKAVAASGRIEALDSVPPGNYELALLNIPGLLIDAFWLKTSSGSDHVVPYDTLTEGLQEMWVYGMKDFMNIVHPRAKKILDDSAGL